MNIHLKAAAITAAIIVGIVSAVILVAFLQARLHVPGWVILVFVGFAIACVGMYTMILESLKQRQKEADRKRREAEREYRESLI